MLSIVKWFENRSAPEERGGSKAKARAKNCIRMFFEPALTEQRHFCQTNPVSGFDSHPNRMNLDQPD
jgi:hypothetical protein